MLLIDILGLKIDFGFSNIKIIGDFGKNYFSGMMESNACLE